MRAAVLAVTLALWVTVEAAQEAAEDFDRFEDNIAMESERQFLAMNFADFTSQFPKTPDLKELLAQVGLFVEEPNSFGKRTGSSSSSAAVAATAGTEAESALFDESQTRKTNLTIGDIRQPGVAGALGAGGSVISQLLGGGPEVENMHEELSGLLFGDQAREEDYLE